MCQNMQHFPSIYQKHKQHVENKKLLAIRKAECEEIKQKLQQLQQLNNWETWKEQEFSQQPKSAPKNQAMELEVIEVEDDSQDDSEGQSPPPPAAAVDNAMHMEVVEVEDESEDDGQVTEVDDGVDPDETETDEEFSDDHEEEYLFDGHQLDQIEKVFKNPYFRLSQVNRQRQKCMRCKGFSERKQPIPCGRFLRPEKAQQWGGYCGNHKYQREFLNKFVYSSPTIQAHLVKLF